MDKKNNILYVAKRYAINEISPDLLKYAYEEVRLLQSLSHRNIVRFKEAYKSDYITSIT